MHGTYARDVRIGGELAGKPSRQFLQAPQHGQHILHVLRAEPLHDGTPRGDELHQPFARQVLDRLAQRCAGNPELFAELSFVQPHSRFQAALDDHVAQARDERVVQRGTSDRSRPAVARLA